MQLSQKVRIDLQIGELNADCAYVRVCVFLEQPEVYDSLRHTRCGILSATSCCMTGSFRVGSDPQLMSDLLVVIGVSVMFVSPQPYLYVRVINKYKPLL